MALANAIAVMAKSPVPGRVKTRLTPPLTIEEAATLYTHFITDTFSTLKRVTDVKLFLAILNDGEEEPPGSIIPEGVEVIEQSGEDLGARMRSVFERLFDGGFKSVAVIGGDSPDISPEYIAEAFLLLEADSSKVVLGPAADGGYYLIAMNRLDERPFSGIKWSTPSVLDDTIASLDGEVELIKPWYDIDEPADIEKLVETGRAKASVAYILKLDIFDRCRDFIDGKGKYRDR